MGYQVMKNQLKVFTNILLTKENNFYSWLNLKEYDVFYSSNLYSNQGIKITKLKEHIINIDKILMPIEHFKNKTNCLKSKSEISNLTFVDLHLIGKWVSQI